MKIPEFKTTGFAILGFGIGRAKLAKYFEKQRHALPDEGIGFRPVNKPIKVTIEAEITDQLGGDDGTSIEFELVVKKLSIKK
jgi:hypothetical protein